MSPQHCGTWPLTPSRSELPALDAPGVTPDARVFGQVRHGKSVAMAKVAAVRLPGPHRRVVVLDRGGLDRGGYVGLAELFGGRRVPAQSTARVSVRPRVGGV